MMERTNDLLTEYVQTYFEWRSVYGLTNECMEELLAAVRVESERANVQPEVRSALAGLACVIATERSSALARAA